MSRPFERWSSVTAAIAVAVGVRAASCTTPVPILIVDVCAATQAPNVKASLPHDSADPHRVEAEALGLLRLLDEALARLRAPVPEHHPELHGRFPPSMPLAAVGTGPYLPALHGPYLREPQPPRAPAAESPTRTRRHCDRHRRQPWHRPRDRAGARASTGTTSRSPPAPSSRGTGPDGLPGSLDETAAEIEAGRASGRCRVPLDLMDRAAIVPTVEGIVRELGTVDVLVNNAIYVGPGQLDRFVDVDPDELDRRGCSATSPPSCGSRSPSPGRWPPAAAARS